MKYLLAALYLFTSAFAAGQSGFLEENPRLAYWEVGKKKEVVLVLHGGPCVEHTYLRPELDRLKKKARLIYYDQRGCGESELAGSYRWQDHVNDLKRMIRKHAPGQKVFLAGSSWGSLLALLYAYHHPEDVKGLILSGLVGWMGKGREEYLTNISPEIKSGDFPPAKIRRIVLKEHKIEQSTLDNGDIVKRLVPIEKEAYWFTGTMHRQTLRSLSTAPVFESLKQITTPTLIFNGTEPCNYYAEVNKYQKILPNAKLVFVEGACHDPWFANPVQFYRESKRFIKKCRKRERRAPNT